ncbi:DUF2577 domain-containing protein [Paenibacillus pasadenensis]|uniref:DUF2577 domain-containing protein n=1 Tax=Paenibacillus pasadenensis TaxID=217090 RepID=A0A2N5N5A4_9BACL|nr:DUF2577 domain-containing protein [Paenibacillus pasadenensis]PLT45490.1 hypothetical protein B8V81_3921 [Paenibacillus pasadenensis]
MDRAEGSGASQLVQLMRSIGWNADTTIELGTVVAEPPELKIRLDHTELVLEKDDLVVAERLTSHMRKVKVDAEKVMSASAGLSPSSATLVTSGGTLTITTQNLEMQAGDFALSDAELTYIDELKPGERVIVAGVQQGQLYLVLDRAVTY